jgi:predicted nucleic acid-binding Zn ribbon protein
MGMPTYVYATIQPDGSDGEMFEVFQRMSDPPLEKHPETGKPVRRVIVPPQVQTLTDKTRFSKGNLERMGFTRYERKGSGYFEKTAGQGPSAISADD